MKKYFLFFAVLLSVQSFLYCEEEQPKKPAISREMFGITLGMDLKQFIEKFPSKEITGESYVPKYPQNGRVFKLLDEPEHIYDTKIVFESNKVIQINYATDESFAKSLISFCKTYGYPNELHPFYKKDSKKIQHELVIWRDEKTTLAVSIAIRTIDLESILETDVTVVDVGINGEK